METFINLLLWAFAAWLAVDLFLCLFIDVYYASIELLGFDLFMFKVVFFPLLLSIKIIKLIILVLNKLKSFCKTLFYYVKNLFK